MEKEIQFENYLNCTASFDRVAKKRKNNEQNNNAVEYFEVSFGVFLVPYFWPFRSVIGISSLFTRATCLV